MFLLFLNVFIMGGPGAGPPGICTRLSASGEPRADARTKTVHSFGDPGNRSLVKGENGNGREKDRPVHLPAFPRVEGSGSGVRQKGPYCEGRIPPGREAGFCFNRWRQTSPTNAESVPAPRPEMDSPEHRECHARQGWDTIHSIFPSVRKLWTGFGKMKWSPFFKGKLLSPTVTLPLPPMTLTRR